MDKITTDAIQRACEALSIAYARHVDFQEYDAFADLFSQQGVMDVGHPITGRDKILRAVQSRPAELRSRHVLTNIYTEVDDPTHAHGLSYLSLYRHIGPASLNPEPIPMAGPAAVGHYEDHFVLEDGRWLFASRKLHFAFQDPNQF